MTSKPELPESKNQARSDQAYPTANGTAAGSLRYLTTNNQTETATRQTDTNNYQADTRSDQTSPR